jgi:S1-C subfamily serine protease
MKRILLVAGSAIAMHAAFGAEAAAAAKDAPVVAAAADAKSAAAAPAIATAADADKARRELVELRREMQELTRKMAALSSELGEGGPRSYAYRYLGDPDRAIVGVVLGASEGKVTVGAVTPDGPAARAGLRGSDVIVAIDHQPVAADSARASVEKAKSLLANLKEGQKVAIDYLRDGKQSSATLVAERREAWSWPMLMNEDPEHPFFANDRPFPAKDFDARVRADVERATHEAERAAAIDHKRVAAEAERATREAMKRLPRHLAMPWWGLNLAPLNADLGRYFGTDKGVLVIAADPDSLPGIRAGDIITRIADEPVERPEDALRALRDQESGKDVPIRILRE